MSDNIRPAQDAWAPPEPYDEPWRVEGSVADRRRLGRHLGRYWAIPLVAGTLAVIGVAAVVEFGDSSSSASATERPTRTAEPGPDHDSVTRASARAAAPTPPEQRESHRGDSARDVFRQRAERRDAPVSTDMSSGDRDLRVPRRDDEEKMRHDAPRRPRPDVRKPRRGPGWIKAECRRRYPDDATRKNACVTVLRGYFRK